MEQRGREGGQISEVGCAEAAGRSLHKLHACAALHKPRRAMHEPRTAGQPQEACLLLTSALERTAEALSTEAVSRVERVGRLRESRSASPLPLASAAGGGLGMMQQSVRSQGKGGEAGSCTAMQPCVEAQTQHAHHGLRKDQAARGFTPACLPSSPRSRLSGAPSP